MPTAPPDGIGVRPYAGFVVDIAAKRALTLAGKTKSRGDESSLDDEANLDPATQDHAEARRLNEAPLTLEGIRHDYLIEDRLRVARGVLSRFGGETHRPYAPRVKPA